MLMENGVLEALVKPSLQESNELPILDMHLYSKHSYIYIILYYIILCGRSIRKGLLSVIGSRTFQ